MYIVSLLANESFRRAVQFPPPSKLKKVLIRSLIVGLEDLDRKMRESGQKKRKMNFKKVIGE
jgi:hypothetical protein